MNKKFYYIYGIISTFPVWVFKSNLNTLDVTILFLLFTVLPVFIHGLILKHYVKTQSKIIYIWLSLITFYSIDQNLGLWVLSQEFIFVVRFPQYYRAIYFSIVSIFFLSFIFFLLRQNALKILFSFLLVIFTFNIFDSSKNYSKFPLVDLSHKKQQTNQNNSSKKIVLIFDEMTGLNSLDPNIKNSKNINEYILKFFSQNKFNIYTNAFSLFKDTDKSLSSALNFIKNKKDYTNINRAITTHFIKKSNNYFTVNDLTMNKFFDLDENENIIVQQSMYINFCDHPKVIICNQFNPFDENLTFLNGFQNTKLTKYVSIFRNNGSIISRLIWRSLLHIRVVDTLLDPDGEKASIQYIFKQLFDNIKNNKNSTLFFSHILVPHIPYGFTANCEYDGGKTTYFNNMSINEKQTQHNLEKYCLIQYLDKFFEELKRISIFENMEIIIFSDHDSRIDQAQVENNVIFVHKSNKSNKSNLIEDKLSINELLYNLNY